MTRPPLKAGVGAGLAGAVVGGWLLSKHDRWRLLQVFGQKPRV